ncbi:MAG: hypothetical protein VYC11_03040, partial [Candidatus Thermoplasmatota archaeon]|nr:hypothetical protein [Candidatus Thermoplasmatota archaeon]
LRFIMDFCVFVACECGFFFEHHQKGSLGNLVLSFPEVMYFLLSFSENQGSAAYLIRLSVLVHVFLECIERRNGH